jgi:hypothetical protein
VEQVGLKKTVFRPSLFSLSFQKFFKIIIDPLPLPSHIIKAFKELNDDFAQDKKASTSILN